MTREETLDIRIRAAKAMGWEQVECINEVDTNSKAFHVFDYIGPTVWINAGIFEPDRNYKQAWALAMHVGNPYLLVTQFGVQVSISNDQGSEISRYRSDETDALLALTLAALQAAEGGEVK